VTDVPGATNIAASESEPTALKPLVAGNSHF